jgi:hypothetical protein
MRTGPKISSSSSFPLWFFSSVNPTSYMDLAELGAGEHQHALSIGTKGRTFVRQILYADQVGADRAPHTPRAGVGQAR